MAPSNMLEREVSLAVDDVSLMMPCMFIRLFLSSPSLLASCYLSERRTLNKIDNFLPFYKVILTFM